MKIKGFLKKNWKKILFVILVFGLGYWLLPDIKKSNETIFKNQAHRENMNSAMEQIKIDCRIEHCQEMDKKDCLENPEYIKCVERAKKRGKRIKK